MRYIRSYKVVLLTLIIFFLSSFDKKPFADKIYINAKIWTGDADNSWAKAVAVKGNKILFVGNDYRAYRGKQTQIIDLNGKLVVPGFIDNHTHFLSGGYQLNSVNLRESKSQPAFIWALKEYAEKLKDERWIMGGDWDHEAWGGELPKKEWIDAVSGNHPVMVSRYDGHMALANSIALKRAGITKSTPNPEGGEIVKDPQTGEPTGILKDEAMNLVFKVIPEPSEKELAEYLQRAVQHAFSNGVTQVHDMGSYGGWVDLTTYRKAHEKHELDLRIYSFVPISNWKKLDTYVKEHGRGDDLLHWGALKGFVDGSLGSTTAWFHKPYLDAPNTTGLQVTDTILLRKWILQADSANLHVAVHAIGDKANDWLLNTYEEAGKTNRKDRRFRVEHAQHLTAQAIRRFSELDVIPSVHPYHLIDDGKWAHKRLDDARLRGTYAFKSLLDNRAKLTFGSDWTVAPLSPIQGIYATVTRRTLDDKNPQGWYPEEKITVEQALTCYTVNNAFAGFQEDKTGKLKAGFYADMVVLDTDIFTISPEKIKDAKIIITIVNGKVAYQRK